MLCVFKAFENYMKIRPCGQMSPNLKLVSKMVVTIFVSLMETAKGHNFGKS